MAVVLTIAPLASLDAATTLLSVCSAPPEAAEQGGQRSLYSRQGEEIWLSWSERGDLPLGCHGLALPVAAEAIRWVGPAERPDGIELPREVTLQGDVASSDVNVSDVIWHLAEPPDDSTLAEDEPAQRTQLPDGDASAPRSAWVWAPEAWQQTPEALWELADAERLDALYLTLPVTPEGELHDPDEVEAFVRAASRRGIDIWPVIGDPRDVLAESLPALLNRVAAYRDYNRSVPPQARLAGLQLDIEPYLLAGFSLGGDHWRERYIATIREAHAALDAAMTLDLVVPVWWGNHPAWGERWLDALPHDQLSITVMNYRTDPEALRRGARPFLAWGSEHGVPVRMALESGPLPDETRLTFSSQAASADGEKGQLWLFEQLSPPLLVLLDEPHAGLPGTPFAQIRESTFAGANLTFAGDQARLNAVAASLAAEWRQWPAFSGIAVHGLDAVYW
ncbi:hypothetical protein BWR19_06485 [Halomonas sp. 1513]|nr:hypothetical protein BWR19_06485 [Halomonas sp. 1513]